MDFTLSKQQQMVQKMYREFAENEVKPLAKKVDAEEYFPKETVEKMGKLGMMGIYFPTSVGGAGGDVLSYVMAVEELSKVCGTTGVIVSAHTSLCAAPIYENGTPEQKAKYLPKLCSGEWLGAFGLTEPGAGTDAQGQQTFAKQDPETGDWILNGSKIFITNAGYANVFIVIAVTDIVPDKKGRPTKQCSAFIVERTDPGFSVGKAEDKMGIRGSSTCELIFEDCRIPADRMLGVRGRGFQLAMATLDGGRIGIASQALGIAQGALDKAIQYMKERVQFGKTLDKFQGLQWMLADMSTQLEAARLMLRHAEPRPWLVCIHGTEMGRIGHLKSEPGDRDAVTVRRGGGGQDVHVGVGEHHGDVRQQPRAVERLDLDVHQEDAGLGGRPLDLDDAVGLFRQLLDVRAVAAVHRHSGAAGHESGDLIAGHRRAALGELAQHPGCTRNRHAHIVVRAAPHRPARLARRSRGPVRTGSGRWNRRAPGRFRHACRTSARTTSNRPRCRP